MSTFTSMGCEIVLPDGAPLDGVRALFEERDRRFSRFLQTSELNRVNAAPLGLMLVSEDFASMLSLAFDAASATGGRVTPAVGGAITAAGYDRDFAELPLDGDAVEPVAVQPLESIRLRGRMLLRSAPILLDLNGVVKGRTVDDALALVGPGWICAGGDIATTVPLDVGLPGGDSVRLTGGGLATSSVARRTWVRGGVSSITSSTRQADGRPWCAGATSRSQPAVASQRTSRRKLRCCRMMPGPHGSMRAASQGGSLVTTGK